MCSNFDVFVTTRARVFIEIYILVRWLIISAWLPSHLLIITVRGPFDVRIMHDNDWYSFHAEV